MKNVFSHSKPVFLAALLIVFISATAWQVGSKTKVQPKSTTGDTTKPGKSPSAEDEFRMKDLDKAMKELDEAMKKLNVEMKNLDFSKMEKEIKEAMSKVDMKKISEEIKASMDKVDWNKIKSEVDEAMRNAEKQMKEVDFKKIENEMAELQEKLKKEQLNIKIDGEKIRKEVEESMKKAKVDIEKAKVELKNLKEFTDELERDGLIDKKKGYRIQVKDGELYINGKQQPTQTRDKYKKYFRKDNFTINNDGDDIITI